MTMPEPFADRVGSFGIDARGMEFLVIDVGNLYNYSPDKPPGTGETIVVIDGGRTDRIVGTVLNYSWAETPIIWQKTASPGPYNKLYGNDDD